jgi:hypothetical protein
MSCEGVQERLDDLALARALDGGDAAELRDHAAQCTACGAHLRFLHELGAALEEPAVLPVSAGVLAAAQRRAARVLRAREAPRGLGRELAAALAVALLALPLVVAHAVLVVEGASWLLSAWVPEPVLAWLGAVYLASLALGVGALYGIIPLAVAWRRRSRVESA